MNVHIPPIKSQGIKTKLVPWINRLVPDDFTGVWLEPFMGTGVVGFNVAPQRALLADSNPHLINFYTAVSTQTITPAIVRHYLTEEGARLQEIGESHYYAICERFNQKYNPLDFLFLSRAGFIATNFALPSTPYQAPQKAVQLALLEEKKQLPI